MRLIQLTVVLALALGTACQTTTSFDTGWDKTPPTKRESVSINQSFDAVSTRLGAYLASARMDKLHSSTAQQSGPTVFSTSSGRVLTATVWVEGQNLDVYGSFFACSNGRPLYIAAGSLFVIERGPRTDVEYHLGLNGTLQPIQANVCTLTPGFVSQLLRNAGVI